MEIDRQQGSQAPASGASSWLVLLSALAASACMAPVESASTSRGDVSVGISLLTADERRERAGQIRDAALVSGMTQGYLLAGIADAETSMSHCWSELTWACMGPVSPDCGGGPVVAGAGDGPCEIQQGGLGMFQFDAGTYAQTLAREGERVLYIDGNVQAAVDFVVSMLIRSVYVDGVDDAAQAIAWSNGVRRDNERWDPWIRTVTHYYNGCTPSASCWAQRYAHYLENTSSVHDEMGPDFWSAAPREFAAEYVNQTFPLASQPFELEPNDEVEGHIEMRNTGSASWAPDETFLGTSAPRDGASALAADDWVSPIRAATIDRVVAPGESGRFAFTVRAPSQPGDYPQFFNLVQENVAWFGDQGGPPDDQLQVRVTVVAGEPAPGAAEPDAGERDAGGMSAEDCPADDARCPPVGDAGDDDGETDGDPGSESESGSDAGEDAGSAAEQHADDGCSTAPRSRRAPVWLILLGLCALALRIRRTVVATRPTRAWRGPRRARGSWS
jgi:hypothetical protein